MRSSWRVLAPALVAFAAAVVLGLTLLTGTHHDAPASVVSAQNATATPDAEGKGRRDLSPQVAAFQDFNYGEPGFSATRDKPQSKVWFHDGSWWAVMLDPFTDEVHIFELQDGRWADTGVFVDGRARSNADVYWTGDVLFIASRTSTGTLLLTRYSYAPGRTWVPLSQAPEIISEGGGQSLTIAVDGAGRVWAAWIGAGRVWISHSDPGGTGWASPITPPGGENVQDDDASAITAFAGRIGVLWSNQLSEAFYWTSRVDGDPLTDWVENLPVRQGVNVADGHIKFAISPTGEVFAAVKTSMGDDGEPAGSPLIEVLHRDLTGVWTSTIAATVENQMTRPQLLITADGRHLVLIATSPQSGGALYYKIADTADPRFAPGKGSILLAWDDAVINDASTTRAPVDPNTPLVVIASDSATAQYYHAELRLADVL